MNIKNTAESVSLPSGFRSAGIHAGIKQNDVKDMALFVSSEPAQVAGVFTTNQVKSATVKLCQSRLAHGVSRGVVINSGNANACTGEQGMRDAQRMAAYTAESLGYAEEDFMVCSTGSIGFPLPMDIVEAGIESLALQLEDGNAVAAAEAILTTDTHPKTVTRELSLDGKSVRITGIAKGAGMIEPNMATMLCFLFTDANVHGASLQRGLAEAVNQSFNRITVDGDQSTNDTVLFFANGASASEELNPQHSDWEEFQSAVNEMTLALAMMIVRDGEGASKLVTVCVEGARSDEDADHAARAIANSLLVKTSWGGKLAIWGRIMDAIGYSACQVEEEKVDIDYDELPAVRSGMGVESSADALPGVIAQNEFTISVNLNLGNGAATMYTCEISREYVKINEE